MLRWPRTRAALEDAVNQAKYSTWVAIALFGLMFATRLSHFGAVIHLPDATLAVFFLAALSGLSGRMLALLLIGAVGFDGVLFMLGTSQACVSPAYPALVLAYVVMWFAGRAAAQRGFGAQAATLLAATTLAFMLTSGAYYVLSGHFAEPTVAGFMPRVAAYLPRYLLDTSLYAGLGLVVSALLGSRTSALQSKV